PPRSPAPPGNGPVSMPRSASVGRALLRVKQRQQPGAEDGQAVARDSRAVATDRPARADSLKPATAAEPATASQPATAAEPSTAGDPGGPGPEPSGRRIRGRVLAAGGVVVVAAAVVSGV